MTPTTTPTINGQSETCKWPAHMFLYKAGTLPEEVNQSAQFDETRLPVITRLAHRAFGRCFKSIGADFVELRKRQMSNVLCGGARTRKLAKRQRACRNFSKWIKEISR